MENFVLILSLILLFCIGLVPVVLFDRYIRKRRTHMIDTADRHEDDPNSAEAEAKEEFESTGMFYFDPPCDPGQIDKTDLIKMD